MGAWPGADLEARSKIVVAVERVGWLDFGLEFKPCLICLAQFLDPVLREDRLGLPWS